MNCPDKVIQSGAIEMELSGQEFIYCSRKMSLMKPNEHYKISFRSVKNYLDEIFIDKLSSIKFHPPGLCF